MRTIYLISAISCDIKDIDEEGLIRSEYLTGYFTNLKLAYSNLHGKKIPSYSTVSRKINQDKVINIENVILKINEIDYNIKSLVIRPVTLNGFYSFVKYIAIEPLIIGEIERNHLSEII